MGIVEVKLGSIYYFGINGSLPLTLPISLLVLVQESKILSRTDQVRLGLGQFALVCDFFAFFAFCCVCLSVKIEFIRSEKLSLNVFRIEYA